MSDIRTAKATFKRQFKRGEDWKNAGADHETNDIDMSYFDPIASDAGYTKWWGGKVQVHGDGDLRNTILDFLTREPVGYAVNVPGAGGINLYSCAPSRRSAIVRWLLLFGLPITADMDDDAIESIWRHHRQLPDNLKAYCIRIKLFAAQEDGSDVSDQPGMAVAGKP